MSRKVQLRSRGSSLFALSYFPCWMCLLALNDSAWHFSYKDNKSDRGVTFMYKILSITVLNSSWLRGRLKSICLHSRFDPHDWISSQDRNICHKSLLRFLDIYSWIDSFLYYPWIENQEIAQYSPGAYVKTAKQRKSSFSRTIFRFPEQEVMLRCWNEENICKKQRKSSFSDDFVR